MWQPTTLKTKAMSLIFKCLVISLILGMNSCQTTSAEQGASRDQAAAEVDATNLTIAASYLESGRPDRALQELQPIIDSNPKNAEALNLMGLAQLALKNPKRAVQFIEKAYKIKPSTAFGVNLSSAFLESERAEDADRLLRVLLAKKEQPPYPHRERLFHNWGLALIKLKRMNAAEKSFKKAIEQNPTFYLSRMELAAMYREQKKSKLAFQELDAARFACPTCFEPTAQVARHYINIGRPRLARQLLQDYRITEGVTQSDRRKLDLLETELFTAKTRVARDASTNNR